MGKLLRRITDARQAEIQRHIAAKGPLPAHADAIANMEAIAADSAPEAEERRRIIEADYPDRRAQKAAVRQWERERRRRGERADSGDPGA